MNEVFRRAGATLSVLLLAGLLSAERVLAQTAE